MSDILGLSGLALLMVIGNYLAILLMNRTDGLPLQPALSLGRAVLISFTPLGWVMGTAIWLFPLVWLMCRAMGEEFP